MRVVDFNVCDRLLYMRNDLLYISVNVDGSKTALRLLDRG